MANQTENSKFLVAVYKARGAGGACAKNPLRFETVEASSSNEASSILYKQIQATKRAGTYYATEAAGEYNADGTISYYPRYNSKQN